MDICEDNTPKKDTQINEYSEMKPFKLEKGNFLKTEIVAEILDVESEVIRDLIRKGELYAIKVGRAYRITEQDLQEFLSNRYTRNKH